MPEQTPYNPLTSEQVVEREYTKTNVPLSPQESATVIAEPVFKQPDMAFARQRGSELLGESESAQSTSTPGPQPPSGGNAPKSDPGRKPSSSFTSPGYTELGDKEKQKASGELAKAMLFGYSVLWGKAGGLAKFSEPKLSKLHMDGQIDLQLPVASPDGQQMPMQRMFQGFNEAVTETFVVDDEVQQKVLPPLTRMLAKRGLGASDEMLVLMYLGADSVNKTWALVQLINTQKAILKSCQDMTAAINGRGTVIAPVAEAPADTKAASVVFEAPVAKEPPPPPPPMEPIDDEFKDIVLHPQRDEEPGLVTTPVDDFGDLSTLKRAEKISLDNGGTTTGKLSGKMLPRK